MCWVAPLLKLCVCTLFLFVVMKLRHCWYNLALVRIIVLVAAYCVVHAKPCMLCFVMRMPACWSWFFEIYCTRRLLRFVNDCNKEDYYYYYHRHHLFTMLVYRRFNKNNGPLADIVRFTNLLTYLRWHSQSAERYPSECWLCVISLAYKLYLRWRRRSGNWRRWHGCS